MRPTNPIATSGHAALRKGRASCPGTAYLITTTTERRDPVFASFPAACIVARCFESRALLRDSQMMAWVLMPDHAHWLIHLGETDKLDHVVSRLKSASSRLVNQTLGAYGSLWCSGYHDHGLRDETDLASVARYMVANPLRAGLTKRLGDYPFWNAIWLDS